MNEQPVQLLPKLIFSAQNLHAEIMCPQRWFASKLEKLFKIKMAKEITDDFDFIFQSESDYEAVRLPVFLMSALMFILPSVKNKRETISLH